jgi:phosphopantetheine adenylyltransferase
MSSLDLRKFFDQKQEILETLSKDPKVSAELSKAETEGYKAFHEIHKDKLSQISWSESAESTRSSQIKNKSGEVICDLQEKTISSPQQITMSDGTQKTIEKYREVDFPINLENGKGPLHLSMAVKNTNGRNIDEAGAVYFTADYDKNGQLSDISSPKPIKFSGKGDDAIGYIEKDGEVYTLPITQGKYRSMTQQLERNKNQTLEKKAVDKIISEPELSPQELNKESTKQQTNEEKSISAKNSSNNIKSGIEELADQIKKKEDVRLSPKSEYIQTASQNLKDDISKPNQNTTRDQGEQSKKNQETSPSKTEAQSMGTGSSKLNPEPNIDNRESILKKYLDQSNQAQETFQQIQKNPNDNTIKQYFEQLNQSRETFNQLKGASLEKSLQDRGNQINNLQQGKTSLGIGSNSDIVSEAIKRYSEQSSQAQDLAEKIKKSSFSSKDQEAQIIDAKKDTLKDQDSQSAGYGKDNAYMQNLDINRMEINAENADHISKPNSQQYESKIRTNDQNRTDNKRDSESIGIVSDKLNSNKLNQESSANKDKVDGILKKYFDQSNQAQETFEKLQKSPNDNTTKQYFEQLNQSRETFDQLKGALLEKSLQDRNDQINSLKQGKTSPDIGSNTERNNKDTIQGQSSAQQDIIGQAIKRYSQQSSQAQDLAEKIKKSSFITQDQDSQNRTNHKPETQPEWIKLAQEKEERRARGEIKFSNMDRIDKHKLESIKQQMGISPGELVKQNLIQRNPRNANPPERDTMSPSVSKSNSREQNKDMGRN